MPIKIVKKGAPSNQTQILPKSASSTSPISPPKGPSDQQGYIPFIDKITVTLSLPSSDMAPVYAKVSEAIKTTSILQHTKLTQGFKICRMIALPQADTAERVLFQFDKGEGKTPHCRIEFNPEKIGFEGLNSLDSTLCSIFPDGWTYFVKHGRISRIDIAVDIAGVRMDDFLVLPWVGLTMERYLRNGHLETLTMGQKKGNMTRIYSKKKEQLAKGLPFGQSVVRVECVLRNPSLGINDLVELKNPFDKVVLTEKMPPPPPGEDERRWSRFQDSVKVRGQGPALALLPKNRKTEYRKHLLQYPKPWWDPEAIWKHWPDVCINLK